MTTGVYDGDEIPGTGYNFQLNLIKKIIYTSDTTIYIKLKENFANNFLLDLEEVSSMIEITSLDSQKTTAEIHHNFLSIILLSQSSSARFYKGQPGSAISWMQLLRPYNIIFGYQ